MPKGVYIRDPNKQYKGGRKPIHGHARRGNKRSEYTIWANMKSRCMNPNSHAYHHYGGRGITVCDRWKNSFENFLADMGDRPVGTSLERINNNLSYTPENCKWAGCKEQRANQRNSLSQLPINASWNYNIVQQLKGL